MQDLGTLGLASEGLDINDNSQIVGSSYTPAGAHAFFWTESAGMVDLFTATGLTTATGINNNLQVVGRLGNGHAALVQLMLVTNNPPVAATGGPYTSAEGAAVNLSLTGTDPDDDALTFTWDLGDGTAGTGATPPASHVYGDGPAQHTITLTVRHADGGTA